MHRGYFHISNKGDCMLQHKCKLQWCLQHSHEFWWLEYTNRMNIHSVFTSSSVRALSCVMLHRVCCYISSELPAWINYSAPCHNSEDALIMTDSQTRQRSKCMHSPLNLRPLQSLRGHWIQFFFFFLPSALGKSAQASLSSLDLQRAMVILRGGRNYTFHSLSGAFHHFLGPTKAGAAEVSPEFGQ